MLKIRLQRVGRKNHAAFRVVVSEHARAAKKANIVEALGSYDPHGSIVALKEDRVQYWIGKGAQASETVHNLLVKKGIINGEKKVVFKVNPPKPKEASKEKEAEAAPQAEATPETQTEEAVAEAPATEPAVDETTSDAEQPKAE